jgi:hypothetical protein
VWLLVYTACYCKDQLLSSGQHIEIKGARKSVLCIITLKRFAMRLHVIILIFIITVAYSTVHASVGDRHPLFQSCVHNCTVNTGCALVKTAGQGTEVALTHGDCPLRTCNGTPELVLRVTKWDCKVLQSDCVCPFVLMRETLAASRSLYAGRVQSTLL